MQNYLRSAFIGLYHSIFEDCAAAYPEDKTSLWDDYSYLEALFIHHGSPAFTLWLPAAGKLFDKSLDRQLLELKKPVHLFSARHELVVSDMKMAPEGFPMVWKPHRQVWTTQLGNIPRLFSSLFLRVFDEHGCLRHDADPTAVLFLRTFFYTVKKFAMDCSPKAKYAAIKEYYDVESCLPPPSSLWDGDGSSCFDADLGSLSDFGRGPGQANGKGASSNVIDLFSYREQD